jgi:hypothetical protein
MFFVTLISRGQTRVQAKWFSQTRAHVGEELVVFQERRLHGSSRENSAEETVIFEP